jgi:CRISPR system Cascade subunit CasC
MSEKNFINYHVLISHSPSCLNRDDMNMQKSTVFGGVRRVRISSQSLKRAMRKSEYYQKHLGDASDRTRELGVLARTYQKELSNDFSPEVVSTVIGLMAAVTTIEDNTRSGAVAVWSKSEISKYCEKYQAALDAGMKPDDIQKEFAKLYKKEFAGFNEAFRNTIDIALSGRMAASGLMTKVDGSLAVAHVITTHAVDGDIDWFTAVDDLVQDEGDTGSAHLDTQEFSSGVFYRYASLNINQLMKNIGTVDRNEALKIAAHTLHMLATVVPTAKQNSFAAHNMAELAMVSFSDQPISLANAFEEPVKSGRNGDGFLMPSLSAFADYKKRVYEGYGLDDKTAFFCLRDNSGLDEKLKKSTLEDLKNWINNNGEA